MENEELTKKLGKFAGFTDKWGRWRYDTFKETNHWWEAPNGRKFMNIPDFPHSFDALFKWVVPKAKNHFGYDVLDILLCDWIHRICRSDITKAALALAEAIEKLIDMEGKERQE